MASYNPGDYLDYKVKILKQLGLGDTAKTKAYLHNASCNATTELQRQIQIDNAARKIIMDFYDGDRTYYKKGR